MNKSILRQDILAVLQRRKIKLHRLALESGVDGKSLWLFMNREAANLNTDTLFKLWPHIYGEQSPVLLPACAGKEDARAPVASCGKE